MIDPGALPTSVLICSPNEIEVGVRLATLQASDTNAFSGHLADPQCSTHRVRGDFVWYQAPRQAGVCGNVLKVSVNLCFTLGLADTDIAMR